MTRQHHREEAEQRIRASDWQWQEGPERAGVEPTRAVVLGSVREAIVALTEAVLALSATERVETASERVQRCPRCSGAPRMGPIDDYRMGGRL